MSCLVHCCVRYCESVGSARLNDGIKYHHRILLYNQISNDEVKCLQVLGPNARIRKHRTTGSTAVFYSAYRFIDSSHYFSTVPSILFLLNLLNLLN